MIEDDENDLLFLKHALNKKGLGNPVHACPDGVDAMAYLEGKGDYGDREKYPFPRVLITDIKLPKGDGSKCWSGCGAILSAQ